MQGGGGGNSANGLGGGAGGGGGGGGGGVGNAGMGNAPMGGGGGGGGNNAGNQGGGVGGNSTSTQVTIPNDVSATMCSLLFSLYCAINRLISRSFNLEKDSSKCCFIVVYVKILRLLDEVFI